MPFKSGFEPSDLLDVCSYQMVQLVRTRVAGFSVLGATMHFGIKARQLSWRSAAVWPASKAGHLKPCSPNLMSRQMRFFLPESQ